MTNETLDDVFDAARLVAEAIASAFISPNETDSNMEAANIVVRNAVRLDGVHGLMTLPLTCVESR